MQQNEIEINEQIIDNIIKFSGIKENIVKIGNPHRWIMELRKILLSNGQTLILKIGINDEWTDEASILNQVAVAEILGNMGIQPKILSFEANKAVYGFRFLLFNGYTGKKLYDIYNNNCKKNRIKIFEALGRTYDQIHRKKNSWSGVWNGCLTERKYPIHPAKFYSDAEFHSGSGSKLFETGKINKNLFNEICEIWDNNLQYLEERPASLVHISPFPWSIYLNQNNDIYDVTGLSSIGDFMWWDAMSDVAHLLYPPFMDITDDERKAFLQKYKGEINYKAISLYKLLNRICALSDVYIAPMCQSNKNEWINKEVLQLNNIINEIRANCI